ncbi:MAG: DNA modification methylase [Candidatus Deianiraeaceae bacterium]|jgi:DNA modification methylase
MLNQLLYGDNLEVMRKMQSESIDLMYLDPHFNSNRNYNFLYSQVTGRSLPEEAEAFCDAWKLDIDTEEKSVKWQRKC